jgi:hypothetical protein
MSACAASGVPRGVCRLVYNGVHDGAGVGAWGGGAACVIAGGGRPEILYDCSDRMPV